MKARSAIEALSDGFDDYVAAPTTHGRHVSIPTRFVSMLHHLWRGCSGLLQGGLMTGDPQFEKIARGNFVVVWTSICQLSRSVHPRVSRNFEAHECQKWLVCQEELASLSPAAIPRMNVEPKLPPSIGWDLGWYSCCNYLTDLSLCP
jgi:hypothetical protein